MVLYIYIIYVYASCMKYMYYLLMELIHNHNYTNSLCFDVVL